MMLWKKLRPFLKPSSGIGRGHGRRNGKGNGAKAQVQAEKLHPYGGEGKTTETVDVYVNASASGAIEQLREMAARGEVPYSVRGNTKEDLAHWYEEFDRLYDNPPGELGKYKTKPITRREIQIDHEHTYLGGKQPPAKTAHDVSKASPEEISGAIKYAIYQRRPVLEQGFTFRASGWPTQDMKQKYGAPGTRVFSNAEKTRIEQEIKSHLESLVKSPLSKGGQRYADGGWERKGDGWIRVDA